jgi:class 3 adenylate cyclase
LVPLAYYPEVIEPLLALVRAQWGMGAAAFSAVFVPSGDPAQAAAFTEFQRVAARGEAAARWLEAFVDVDTTSLLKDIQVPTLVVHRRHDRAVPFRAGREMAALIPGARLEPLEGDIHIPFWGDSKAILDAIDGFLREGEAKTEVEAPAAAPGALLTILFTDMEGSTTLTQRLGDAKAQEVLRTHNAIIRDVLKAQSGSEIKHTGDGIMASFASASGALECAIDIQRALAQHNESNPDTPIRVRIGLNAGEPVAEEKDLFGTAVQLAARITAKAEAEEILVSDTLRGLVAGKGFLFSDRGDVALRGFEDPVRLYEARWQEEG